MPNRDFIIFTLPAILFVKLFGEFDSLLGTLVICMVVDYLSSIFCVIFFKRGRKKNKLDVRESYRGLIRKSMLLSIVAICYRLDLHNIAGVGVIRDSVIICFIINEFISILATAILMDIPIPDKLKQIINTIKTTEIGD